ncbi:alpha/beta hydrolase [Lysinimonas soli]|uniref:Alpha/beta hydrolase n=1 Tax=Lysinimonas soli TaxID=1074233 RepID=A0ABW0NW33_9MICO
MASSQGRVWWHRFRPSEKARRRIGVVAAVVLTVVVIGGLVGQSTPWPSALVIRSVFEKGAAETVAEMNKHVPSAALTEHLDVQYGDGSAGGNTTLDAFSPSGGGEALPVVVWVHGGAWISGQKSDVDPYLRILASHGYAAVSLNYTIAPEAVYPTAVRQLNDALGYLDRHAAEFRIDRHRIVLAGDSAGAQLASQLAVLTTNPDYAELLGIQPALSADQLVGTVLNCGVYDLSTMADLTGIGNWGFKVALWAYTGTQNWSASYQGTTMSTIDFVTSKFPATYISGGNGDALTWIESVPMYNKLSGLGVDVTPVFYAADHEPALPHEYQFHLDGADAQHALQKTLDFLALVTAQH